MNNISSAINVLREAEQQLQGILANAAKEGDYAAIGSLTDWAFQLSLLIRNPQARRKPSNSDPPPQRRRESPRGRKSNRKGQPAKGERYPKFVRDRNFLIKIGWSKSSRSEYEHKAERDNIFAVIAAIAVAGGRGKCFQMEELIPFKNSAGEKIPDYQAYLTLAWLRSSSLVTQHGRHGYTVPNAENLQQSAESCWTNIEIRESARN
jgi:hypothetical protein